MESPRLKWQEVKGECTENSRQLHTTAAAVALPNHSTVMIWQLCVCVFQCACVCVYVYVRMREGRRMSEKFFVKILCDPVFLFTGIYHPLVIFLL